MTSAVVEFERFIKYSQSPKQRLIGLAMALIGTATWLVVNGAHAAPERLQKSGSSLERIQSIRFWVADETMLLSDRRDEICKISIGLISHIAKTNRPTPCGDIKTKDLFAYSPISRSLHVHDPTSPLQIVIWRDLAGEWRVHVSNTQPQDPTETQDVEWIVKGEDWSTTRKALGKLLIHVISYYQNYRAIKREILIRGVHESNNVRSVDGENFVAPNGEALDFDTAYRLFYSESRRQTNYLYAGLEISLLLAGGTSWYYKNQSLNEVDWDFGRSSGLRRRFTTTEQIRFDNNNAGINRKHLNAGAAYHLAARSNGLGLLESALFNFAASSFWEYVIEFREVVSINDQIVTPVGGFVLGEVLYQIGRQIIGRSSQLAAEMVISSFGGEDNLSQFIRKFARFSGVDISGYGFDANIIKSLEVGLSQQMPKGGATSQRLYIESEIYNIPLANSQGRVSRVLSDTNFTRLLVESTGSSSAESEFRLLAETAFLAYHRKNLQNDERGQLYGYSFLVAPTSALDIYTNKSGTSYNDMIVNVSVLGSTMHFMGFWRGVKLRIVMSVYGDFAMVQAYALERVREHPAFLGSPSVLRDEGYYYASGVSGAARMSLEHGPMEIGASSSGDQFYSLAAPHRDQEQITWNPALSDRQTRHELFSKLRMGKSVNLRCGLGLRTRVGALEQIPSLSLEDNYRYCRMTYSFL